jgi:hypothetical protein
VPGGLILEGGWPGADRPEPSPEISGGHSQPSDGNEFFRFQRVEAEAAAAREATGARVLGVKKILAQDPLYRPKKLARSPAPLVHAATQAARKAFREAYSWFVAAFRDAAEKLRKGDRSAPFPAGCFPPALPFVAG